jgi:hypothetical protein
MLRIRRSLNGDAVTIELIGRFLDHDLPQLEALIEAERQGLALNLKQVTIVKRGGGSIPCALPASGRQARGRSGLSV